MPKSHVKGQDDRVDALWLSLVQEMTTAHTDIRQGKMMSADALTLDGKVFVFRSRRNGAGLGCKLGSDMTPDALSLTAWRPLQPFKGKAPMTGWYVVDAGAFPDWVRVAETALKQARKVAAHV